VVYDIQRRMARQSIPSDSIQPKQVYAVGDAARLLGLSPSSLRNLQQQGRLQCTRTPGGQRRFLGADLMQLAEASSSTPIKNSSSAQPRTATAIAEQSARQAWLSGLISRTQQELPVDTSSEVRLRLAADLERELRTLGPTSPIGDVEPLVKRLIERARLQAQQAQEEAQRRETKGQLLEYAQAYLRRSIADLPWRVAGAPDSLKRRHVRATLRDQLYDRLQKRLKGTEDWNHVRDLVDELLAAWYVGETAGHGISDTAKILAVGAIGVAGGAAAAAALDSRIRAAAAKFKEPFLLLALDLLKRVTTPLPSAAPPPNPANPATTPSQSGPSTRFVFVRPSFYRPTRRSYRPGSYRPVVPKSDPRPPENR
jgi:DNA-binding transcriptional MerR regulator